MGLSSLFTIIFSHSDKNLLGFDQSVKFMDGLLDGLGRPCSPRSIAISPNNGIYSLTQPPGLLQSASNSGIFDPTLWLSITIM